MERLHKSSDSFRNLRFSPFFFFVYITTKSDRIIVPCDFMQTEKQWCPKPLLLCNRTLKHIISNIGLLIYSFKFAAIAGESGRTVSCDLQRMSFVLYSAVYSLLFTNYFNSHFNKISEKWYTDFIWCHIFNKPLLMKIVCKTTWHCTI